MENNTNEILGIGDKETSNIDLEVFDYSSYRDSFWQKRYPVSRFLYQGTKVFIFIVVILSFILTAFSINAMEEFALFFLLVGGIIIVIFLFISETILFQIDKNFFSYLDVHNKLEQLRDKK
jgi:cellulose synthase/poly-beta-1,6-N-acetylglucosamine synthase-like glycosyltransferase